MVFKPINFNAMNSRGMSSLWLPFLMVICTVTTLYALGNAQSGLRTYKTFITSTRWFDEELISAAMPLSEICDTSLKGVQICQFRPAVELYSNQKEKTSPQNTWIDWDALTTNITPCKDPCLVDEALPKLSVYDHPIEFANATCLLPECTIASTEQITINNQVNSVGNITILARGNITLNAIALEKEAGALLISTQGAIEIKSPPPELKLTIVRQFSIEPLISSPLPKSFSSQISIIEGIREVRVNWQYG